MIKNRTHEARIKELEIAVKNNSECMKDGFEACKEICDLIGAAEKRLDAIERRPWWKFWR